ncbi:MAG: LamG-like jellyroll fold domain-containing protein [Thermogutta sp.]
MTLVVLVGIQALFASGSGNADSSPAWQRQYSGEEVTGPHVIALWQFLPGQEAVDNSGHKHDLQLRGQSRFAADGVFGNCLESFRAEGERNIGHGAVVKNHPSLSPSGAFTLELWIKPKPELEECDLAFLLDKKYLHYPRDTPQANRDYCLYLRRTGSRKFRLIAYLGFGNDSAEFSSQEIALEPNRWVHVAFSYDGAGMGRFFLNGEPVGRTFQAGRRAIAPGQYDLVIGDRYGSLYSGFPGWIDQVRILGTVPDWAGGSLEVELAPLARTAFLRMEKPAEVGLVLRNDTPRELANLAVLWSLAGQQGQQQISQLAQREDVTLKIPVDTRLRPDRYSLRITAKVESEHKTYQVEREIPIVIVSRPLPNTMPVIMWGTGDLDRLAEIGFTHQLVNLADFNRIWSAGQPTWSVSSAQLAERAEMLNEYLARGVGAVVTLSPGSWVVRDPQLQQRFQRVDRKGQPYKDANPCGLFPELGDFCFNVGSSVGETFREFPALQAALIHTEVRDSTNLCFHEHDREAYRKKTGLEIPEQAASKWGVRYEKLPQFPENRVIADDDPLLTFYRWFWREGDGWNAMHSAVHRGLKANRPDLWTFFDPAVRAPSVWGSGGEVDVISQWTYTYPDPIKIGQAADELFAMAEGRPGQQVMKMTQIIWYRSQTAPKLPEDESKQAAWEKEIPDAKFITIAPDHLREAFWSKISRPVRGIMYHGWGSLVPAEHGDYRFTNPQTKEVLQELIRTIVRPLGPMLLQVPDEEADVAILESFTSQIFAGRGTYGWGRGWEADLHLLAQWCRLQPRIIYEETVLKSGLSQYRVLILPACDVLPASVVASISEFQKRGGIVIGDEFLTPGVKADIRISSYRRTGQADKDKAALQQIAQALRNELQSRYRWRLDSSDPDLVVRLRRYNQARYVFVLNDRRTFGDYVGHHGMVMEKGLPLEGEVYLEGGSGTVYDLVEHHQVEVTSRNGGLSWPVKLGPGDGRVYVVLERPLERVEINLRQQVQLAENVPITIRILDAAGQPVSAVVPVEMTILDPQGRPAEPSGFYGVKDGELTVSLELAPNDLFGVWKLTARELASGRETVVDFQVK